VHGSILPSKTYPTYIAAAVVFVAAAAPVVVEKVLDKVEV